MIQIALSTDVQSWNGFLEKEKENQIITIAHNPSLGPILSKTFGYSNQNLSLTEHNEIIGVMPVVFFSNRAISMPHFSYGGPIISTQKESEVNIKSFLGSKKFEIRSFSKLSEHSYDQKVSCILEVRESEEAQIMSFTSKLRYKLRKSEKIDYQISHGGVALLKDYYDLYSRKMLKFGSPPIGKVFFQNLLEEYAYGEPQITVIYNKDKAVAAAFSLSYLNFNEVCWSATDSDYDRDNIHARIFWEILKTSVAKKYKYFSFGRSTVDSNTYKFKKQWSPSELPIFYNYSEPTVKSIKEHKYLTKIWKHQPLVTSVYLGQLISKYLY
jgi:hypothetical protein